ncbi:putative reverse transcriptase domain-containing protein [Tanacetum coccineum]
MAPRGRPTRTTRSRPVTATPPPVTDPTTTTSVTNAQLQAMIGHICFGSRRATTQNGDDSHTSGTGVRRNERRAFGRCFLNSTDKKKGKQKTRGSFEDTPRNKPKPPTNKKAETQSELMLAERDKKSVQKGLNLYVPSVTSTINFPVYQHALTARSLATWPRTMKVRSTQFSTLINIAPTTLDHGYNVELADGRIIWVNTVLLGCTLNFLNHPFHVDLMPVEMGTYDVIIGMDWLTKYQAVIDCAKKIVRIPFGSKILIFHGDGSRNKRGTRLNIISCTKTPKVSTTKMSHLFGTYYRQGDWRQVEEEATSRDVPDRQKFFPKNFLPRTCQPFHLPYKWNFHNRSSNLLLQPVARARLSIGPIRNERIGGSLQSFPQKLIKMDLVQSHGRLHSIRQEERWSITMCIDYRTKQTNGEEPNNHYQELMTFTINIKGR